MLDSDKLFINYHAFFSHFSLAGMVPVIHGLLSLSVLDWYVSSVHSSSRQDNFLLKKRSCTEYIREPNEIILANTGHFDRTDLRVIIAVTVRSFLCKLSSYFGLLEGVLLTILNPPSN